jgi:hypothetical protein
MKTHLTWVQGKAKLSDAATEEIVGEGGAPLSPSESLKRPLLGALRTNNTNLKGERRLTKTRADVSKYLTEVSLHHFEPGTPLLTIIKSPVKFSCFNQQSTPLGLLHYLHGWLWADGCAMPEFSL